MSEDGSDSNMIKGVKALVNNSPVTSQKYWILYSVKRRPVEDSTYHVKEFSTVIPEITKPEDVKNLLNALKEFRTNEAPNILKHHRDALDITVLRTYLDPDEANKDAKNYNSQYVESKKISRGIQSK
jgi:hypothetical protein